MKIFFQRKLSFALLFCMATLFFCSAGQPDTTGTAKLNGCIYDFTSKGPIENAKITIHSAQQDQTVYTDEEGKFKLADMGAGVYEVTVSADGYKDAFIPDFEVQTDEAAYLIVKLKQRENIFSLQGKN